MTLSVYVWLQKDGNVGHGSLELGDGTYISWWPAEDKSKTSITFHWTSVEASTSPSYRDDCEAEGRSANYEFTISKLDDAAIKRWWVQFSDSSKYHLLGNNCCNVVFKALKEGGADKFVSIPWTLVATPVNLKDYSMKLQQATQ